MSIGEVIKSHRKYLGMTQKELGNIVGVSKNTIISWEAGRTFPNRTAVAKMSQALNINESELVYGQDVLTIEQINPNAAGFLKANELTAKLVGLFAGGELSENDKDAVMMTLQSAYIACKTQNKKIYGKSGEDEG